MIELTDWLRHELERRADVEAFEECCGLISRATEKTPGHSKDGIALWAAENIAADPTSGFEIAPGTLLGIIRQIAGRSETLVGVYHSHPAASPAPSTEDITTAANWPGLTWIILGRQRCGRCDGEGDLRGERLEEGGVPLLCPNCVDAEPPGTVPAFWAGVLA